MASRPHGTRVLLDVSPITARPESRTGLARVALSLGLALAARDDLDIRASAWGSLIASAEFEAVRAEFPALCGVPTALSSWERTCAEQGRAAASRPFLGRAFWHRASQITNRLRNPLAGVDLAAFDIVHSTYARFPRVVRRQRLPTVLTLHDVMPLRLPADQLPPGQRAITGRILADIRPHDWVACVSAWTRQDFLDITGHPPDRVVVIPNGVDHGVFRPVTDPAAGADVRRRLGIGTGPYFVTLSSLAPHKNLRFLCDAWSRSHCDQTGAKLVIAGGRSTDRTALLRMLGIASPPAGIVVTGHVTDDEFRSLASGCQAFLFPSLYEGFGLPVLEAMACGAPVIASDATSIPEVVGDAGTLLPPHDPEPWIAALRAAVASPRQQPDPRSLQRATEFSWARAAEGYAALYRTAGQ